MSSCLPTRKDLHLRRVEVPEWRPMCHDEPEDDFHILISCPLALNVWFLSTIGSYVGLQGAFVGRWNNLDVSFSNFQLELAAVVLWEI